jgi:hypothetical protein
MPGYGGWGFCGVSWEVEVLRLLLGVAGWWELVVSIGGVV